MKPFVTQRRKWAVTRNKRHVIAQRQQFTFNRIDQLAVISARKIAAPYATFENHVTRNQ